jgi:hypothetical protein
MLACLHACLLACLPACYFSRLLSACLLACLPACLLLRLLCSPRSCLALMSKWWDAGVVAGRVLNIFAHDVGSGGSDAAFCLALCCVSRSFAAAAALIKKVNQSRSRTSRERAAGGQISLYEEIHSSWEKVHLLLQPLATFGERPLHVLRMCSPEGQAVSALRFAARDWLRLVTGVLSLRQWKVRNILQETMPCASPPGFARWIEQVEASNVSWPRSAWR